MGRISLTPARLPGRRTLIGLLAAAIASPAAVLPAASVAAAPPSITVLSQSEWADPAFGASHIVGEIQNNTGGAVRDVVINVDWKDSHGAVVGHSWTTATKTLIKDGDVSPFEDVIFPDDSLDYKTFAIGDITYNPAQAQPYDLAAVLHACPVGDPSDEVCGRVTNNGSLVVDGVSAILTYKDAGVTVGQDRWGVDNDAGGTAFGHLAHGEFKVLRSDGHSPVTVAVDAMPTYPVVPDVDTLDLGGQNVGTTGQGVVTVNNYGDLTLVFSAPQATPSPEFSATSDCPTSAPGLAGWGVCHVTVNFTPAAAGVRNGTLTITHNAAGTPQTVALQGTGTAPQVTFDPASGLSFGSTQRAGAPGLRKAAKLSNTGNGPLTITAVTTSDAANFTADLGGCPSSPSTLAPGGECPLGVTFSPTVAGPATANLVVTDNAGSGSQTLPLSGSATGPGAKFNVTSLSFGNQRVGSPSPASTVTLTNNGTETLTINSTVLTGDYSKDNGTTTCGTTLAAGSNCAIGVVFTPTQTGNRTGTLTVNNNTYIGHQSVNLSGTGVTSTLSFSPASLDFGIVNPGSSTILTDTITNLGTGNLVITAIALGGSTDFTNTGTGTCKPLPVTVASGNSCTLKLQFAPASSGTKTGTVTLTDNTASGTDRLNLAGSTQAFKAMYTLDGYGGLHAIGGSPPMSASAYWPGWKIARAAALFPDATGGFTLDGYGGVHQFGSAAALANAQKPSYFGWDIARDVALMASSNKDQPMGYTLDGFGGLHPFGGAPAMTGYRYFAGQDIVRKVVLLSDGKGGYTVDAFGNLYPFGLGGGGLPPTITNNSRWPGWKIVRGLALNPGSTITTVSGVTLDAYGGVHPFSSAGAGTPGPVTPQGPYFKNWDIARGVVLSSGSTVAKPQGWVLDGWGGLHAFGGAPEVSSGGAYWRNFDIVVDVMLS